MIPKFKPYPWYHRYDMDYDMNQDIIVQIKDIIVHELPMISYMWYGLWGHRLNHDIIAEIIYIISCLTLTMISWSELLCHVFIIHMILYMILYMIWTMIS
jgi:hypothetical protein